ncbi:hypothetical protein LDENG_00151160 [Lucifuga dentata]|nr:hypothetical protein LDENG_00151160 [Lucifuga dentata]
MAVYRRFPSNLTELERICRKNVKNCLNPGIKACRDEPRRLAAVTAAKGASTKS